jgi:hypothetical protein
MVLWEYLHMKGALFLILIFLLTLMLLWVVFTHRMPPCEFGIHAQVLLEEVVSLKVLPQCLLNIHTVAVQKIQISKFLSCKISSLR